MGGLTDLFLVSSWDSVFDVPALRDDSDEATRSRGYRRFTQVILIDPTFTSTVPVIQPVLFLGW